jgi:hypothetical protein
MHTARFTTRFEEIFTEFGKILAGIEIKMQLSMKQIINESLNNKDVYAMFFECKHVYNDMDIWFYAIDNKKRVFLKKGITEEITGGPLFPEDLREEKDDLEEEIEELEEIVGLEFDGLNSFGNEEKLMDWFMACWDKIKEGYNNIPQIYFSWGNYAEPEMRACTIDLSTGRTLGNNERMQLLKSLKR